jgi:ABC-type sugar transport system substrate-binding protein
MKTVLAATLLALSLAAVPALAQAAEGSTTTINTARIKGALHLRPEQQAYWPAVESAVRDVARHQGVRRAGRVVSIVLDSGAIQRIAAAARPLMATLDIGQLQAANGMASEMGLGAVVAALR